MNEQQYNDLMSEVRALSTLLKWMVEDVETLKETVEMLKQLVERGQGVQGGQGVQQQSPQWRVERM